MDDHQLAVLSQQGSSEAFSVLARRWQGPLLRFLHRLLGSEEEARDARQEVLLRAYLNIGKLRRPEHFKTWLHSIAVNLARDHRRSARSRAALRVVALDAAEMPEPVSADAEPGAELEQQDLAAAVHRALAMLPLDQRTAIVLRELQGMSSHEIGAICAVPATTVRSRIFYGLKALRRLLPDQVRGGTP